MKRRSRKRGEKLSLRTSRGQGPQTAFASIRTARRSQEGDLLEPDLCGSEYFQASPSTGPDLEHSKNAVVNSLVATSSQESYGHAIDEFIGHGSNAELGETHGR